ncbi:MAG: hypothetical protein V4643_10845 [Bacteroidota bacterium]
MNQNAQKKRGVFVQLIASYTNTAFAVISGLFFVPLYFRYIDINTYGSWLASGNVLNMLSIIEGGVAIVFSQKVAAFYGAGKGKEFAVSTASGISISFSIAFLIMIAALSLSPWVPYWVKADAANISGIKWAFLFAGSGSALAIINSAIVVIPRAWHKNEFTSITALVASLMGLLAIFCSLTFFNAGIVSLGIGSFTRSLINLVGNSFYTIGKWKHHCSFKPAFQFNDLKQLLVTTLPVFGSNFLGALLNNSKELLLAILVNPASVSILSITARLFGLIVMVINPLSSSLFSALSSLSLNKEKLFYWIPKLFRTYNFASGIMFGMAISVNAWFISFWVGADKFGGIELSILLGISAWLTTKCNMNIMLLNVQSIFKPTSFISVVDISIRIFFIGLLVLSGIQFKIIYLPLIECFSILFSVLYLEYNLSKSLNDNSSFKNNAFHFFYSLIQYVIIAVLVYWVANYGLIKVSYLNSLYQLVLASCVSLIGFGLFIALYPKNRAMVQETWELIRKRS